MDQIRILWADDEIEMLRSHILFLEGKGYSVETATNGEDAMELIENEDFDIVFLDENMPGLSGIETLERIKDKHSNLPVVMITKSEEESIMEDAIGGKISDYLIKPVNPNQILLCLKKNLENKELISQKTTHSYHMEFRNIGMEISPRLSWDEWKDVYKKIVNWELKLQESKDPGVMEILHMQKNDANSAFAKFYENNYEDWVSNQVDEKPEMSHTLLKNKVLPGLNAGKPFFLLLIDNLRYDQWKTIQPVIEEFYRVDNDDIYCSILPSVTQYSRNALFSGLMPLEIQKKYPQYWLNEDEEGSKNQHEEALLGEFLKRYGSKCKYSYSKVLNINAGKKYVDNLPNLMNNDLNVLVYNFVDMLSHARTEMEVIKELADDEVAYRSLTRSWFMHSPVYDVIRFLSKKKIPLLITTDHGSVKVSNPVKVVGDRNTNTNLRYKTGRNLNYKEKEVCDFKNPHDIYLPRMNVSSSFIFAKEQDFFAYPNNYNYYVNYYRDTFQHGGISMEEIMIPFISLQPK